PPPPPRHDRIVDRIGVLQHIRFGEFHCFPSIPTLTHLPIDTRDALPAAGAIAKTKGGRWLPPLLELMRSVSLR
ncbi:MAG: hypothetical protein SNJ60_04970, partial [Pseudanabaenaceae cyanobacterium]